MNILIPATWYRARAVIVRTWGWSPLEEAVLLALRNSPGTTTSVAAELRVGHQFVQAAVSRLMRFGLIELRFASTPTLAMTDAAREHVEAGRALPERESQREIRISMLFDLIGGSIFRRRDVTTLHPQHLPSQVVKVSYPSDADETDEAMERGLFSLLSNSLRPGESFAGVKRLHSVFDRRFVQIDLEKAKEGTFPEGASTTLRSVLSNYVETGEKPKTRNNQSASAECVGVTISTSVGFDQFLFGGAEHLERLEAVVDAARQDVFILSTFVAKQDDPKAEQGQNRVWAALERACKRGVRVHLFFGSALDGDRKHASALYELGLRLNGPGVTIAAHTESVRSHAKLVLADDGAGGGRALLGSCNWLQSPFYAHEMSFELRDAKSVAGCLEILRAVSSSLSTARGSRDAMQAMQWNLLQPRPKLTAPSSSPGVVKSRITILAAPDHLPLLRRAAHDAQSRFVCLTHKLGAPMAQNLLDPAQIAGERIEDVRTYYSLPTGPVKKRHTRAAKERLQGTVSMEKSAPKSPMFHAKALYWDSDDVVVTSFNWGSQSATDDNPLDEIGLHIHGQGLAERLNSELVHRIDRDRR